MRVGQVLRVTYMIVFRAFFGVHQLDRPRSALREVLEELGKVSLYLGDGSWYIGFRIVSS